MAKKYHLMLTFYILYILYILFIMCEERKSKDIDTEFWYISNNRAN